METETNNKKNEVIVWILTLPTTYLATARHDPQHTCRPICNEWDWTPARVWPTPVSWAHIVPNPLLQCKIGTVWMELGGCSSWRQWLKFEPWWQRWSTDCSSVHDVTKFVQRCRFDGSNCRGLLWHNIMDVHIWRGLRYEHHQQIGVSTIDNDWLTFCLCRSAPSIQWDDQYLQDPASRAHQHVAALTSTYQSVWYCSCCLIARKAFWVVAVFMSHSNRMPADMDWVARRCCCSAALVDAIKHNNRLTYVVLHCVGDIGLAHLLVCVNSWPRYHVEQVTTI